MKGWGIGPGSRASWIAAAAFLRPWRALILVAWTLAWLAVFVVLALVKAGRPRKSVWVGLVWVAPRIVQLE